MAHPAKYKANLADSRRVVLGLVLPTTKEEPITMLSGPHVSIKYLDCALNTNYFLLKPDVYFEQRVTFYEDERGGKRTAPLLPVKVKVR